LPFEQIALKEIGEKNNLAAETQGEERKRPVLRSPNNGQRKKWCPV